MVLKLNSIHTKNISTKDISTSIVNMITSLTLYDKFETLYDKDIPFIVLKDRIDGNIFKYTKISLFANDRQR